MTDAKTVDRELARIASRIQEKAAMFAPGDSFLVDIDAEDVVTLVDSLATGDFWRFLERNPKFSMESDEIFPREPSWNDYAAAENKGGEALVNAVFEGNDPLASKDTAFKIKRKRTYPSATKRPFSSDYTKLMFKPIFGAQEDQAFVRKSLGESQPNPQLEYSELTRRVRCAKNIALRVITLRPHALLLAFREHRVSGIGSIADWIIFHMNRESQTALSRGEFSTRDLIILTLMDSGPTYEAMQLNDVDRIVAKALESSGQGSPRERSVSSATSTTPKFELRAD